MFVYIAGKYVRKSTKKFCKTEQKQEKKSLTHLLIIK